MCADRLEFDTFGFKLDRLLDSRTQVPCMTLYVGFCSVIFDDEGLGDRQESGIRPWYMEAVSPSHDLDCLMRVRHG